MSAYNCALWRLKGNAFSY